MLLYSGGHSAQLRERQRDTPSLYGSVTLGKFLNISEPLFPPLNKGDKAFSIERVLVVMPFFPSLLYSSLQQQGLGSDLPCDLG